MVKVTETIFERAVSQTITPMSSDFSTSSASPGENGFAKAGTIYIEPGYYKVTPTMTTTGSGWNDYLGIKMYKEGTKEKVFTGEYSSASYDYIKKGATSKNFFWNKEKGVGIDIYLGENATGGGIGNSGTITLSKSSVFTMTKVYVLKKDYPRGKVYNVVGLGKKTEAYTFGRLPTGEWWQGGK